MYFLNLGVERLTSHLSHLELWSAGLCSRPRGESHEGGGPPHGPLHDGGNGADHVPRAPPHQHQQQPQVQLPGRAAGKSRPSFTVLMASMYGAPLKTATIAWRKKAKHLGPIVLIYEAANRMNLYGNKPGTFVHSSSQYRDESVLVENLFWH